MWGKKDVFAVRRKDYRECSSSVPDYVTMLYYYVKLCHMFSRHDSRLS